MAPLVDRSVKKKEKLMASVANESIKKDINRGAWTAEEDRKLAESIEIHGAKKWKTIAVKAGLNRCGKSCRLRWLNYLRPNIKRGNISDQEEDLIIRLHKLLGNRWSLIAGRLPGRTDNEIKNYWNSYLSKKISQKEKQSGGSKRDGSTRSRTEKIRVIETVNHEEVRKEKNNICSNGLTGKKNISSNGGHDQDSNFSFDVDDFFDFSTDLYTSEWVSRFLESEDGLCEL